MSRRPTVLYESPAGGRIRTRVLHRATKMTRRAWAEFTNQPGDRDWHHLNDLYRVELLRSGRVRVRIGTWAAGGYRQAEMGPTTAARLRDDLAELLGSKGSSAP